MIRNREWIVAAPDWQRPFMFWIYVIRRNLSPHREALGDQSGSDLLRDKSRYARPVRCLCHCITPLFPHKRPNRDDARTARSRVSVILTFIFRHSYVRRFGTSLVDSSRIPELSKAYNSALASITLRFIDDDSARNDLCESESAQ